VKIYTRRGDGGETTLHGGAAVPKGDERVQAYGTIDELNAVLGTVLSLNPAGLDSNRLLEVQSDLFVIGARLSSSDPLRAYERGTIPRLPASRLADLEAWIDQVESGLPELDAFILPGGSAAGSQLHVARTVCRRAERAVVGLLPDQPDLGELIIPYINRLSDLLFVLARGVNATAGVPEKRWVPVRERPRTVTTSSGGEQ